MQTTSPANGAAGVAPGADIAVTFSEPVNVAGASFTIACTTSGAHTATVSGGPTAFTSNPDADFAGAETLHRDDRRRERHRPGRHRSARHHGGRHRVHLRDRRRPGLRRAATAIHDIQGTGATTPLSGATNVTIEGVVVGDYQGAGQLSGYYVQEEDVRGRRQPATSEGIFVFNTSFAGTRR